MRRGSQASSRKQAGDKATEASPETSKQLMPPPPAKARRGDAVEGDGGASSAAASSSTGASTLSEMPFLALNGIPGASTPHGFLPRYYRYVLIHLTDYDDRYRDHVDAIALHSGS